MRRVKAIGVGQSKHASKRVDVSLAGLVREAVLRALEHAEIGFADIDAVVLGTAPDVFEGVMLPEQWLAGALGANGKPILRIHTAGSVGGATAIAAAYHVAAGVHRRVLAVGFEKHSESQALWGLSPHIPFSPPFGAGAGAYFAPYCRAYMEKFGAPREIGPLVAVKARRNAMRNPYAHLRQPVTVEEVLASPLLWDPIHRLESCPASDGAAAMVLADGDVPSRRAAWVQGMAAYSEVHARPGRDQVDPASGRAAARAAYAQAGVADPRREIDVAEIYEPFSWIEVMWYENLGFCAPGEGWKLLRDGVTDFGGALPVNPSGGVLSTNPIGASGLLRMVEAALQVLGEAGEHQVAGARRALGHAYGGGSQFFAVMLLGSERP
jgi:acetyl-CoA C-acetyltransferase